MSIVLISSLLLIGYLNTKDTTRTLTASRFQTDQSPANSIAAAQTYRFQPFSAYQPLLENSSPSGQALAGSVAVEPRKLTSRGSIQNIGSLSLPADPKAPQLDNASVIGSLVDEPGSENTFIAISAEKISPAVLSIEPLELALEETNIKNNIATRKGVLKNAQKFVDENLEPLRVTSNQLPLSASKVKEGDNQDVTKSTVKASKPYSISLEDREWIENYAMYNRPIPKKWKGKLAWQAYATPSVVYRRLTNDPDFGTTANSAPFVIPVNNQDINSAVTQKPSLGLEVGAGIQYPILKGLRLKTGLQVNFTRYNSEAFHNTHPVATKLTMHDYTTNSTYELFRTTPYSNKTGLSDIKLHNETIQISLPVGLDLKVLGNENLQWNVGMTIQPTYVLGGKSYLISSDRRNYVKETSMLNKWNVNAGFETFISYKANGITYQVGPQFRSQLFSTNSKQFAVEERLLSYGIKFGIMKTIK
jgi:hypothetical protein